MALFLANGDEKMRWSWNEWLANGLFHTKDEKFTILDVRISKRIIEFVRRARRFKESDVLLYDNDKDRDFGQVSVKQYSLGGEYMASFKSLAEAARQTGENSAHISLVTRGKKGYRNHKFNWKKETE